MPLNQGFQETPFINDSLLVDDDVQTKGEVVAVNRILPRGQLLGKVTATGQVVAYAPAAADGSQNIYGVLAQAVDTTLGSYATVVYIAGAFKQSGITPAITPAIETALRGINIYIRPTV